MSELGVSIVIPFYSNVDWLIEAVESVFNQSYLSFEVIVINDGSKENVHTFLNRFGKKVKYIEKENGGPASARNYGIEISSGKYIAFLDSDDVWLPDKLKLQVKFMEDSGAIWSHTNYSRFRDETGSMISNHDLSGFSGNIFPQCLLKTHIATPTVMVRSNFIKSRASLRFNQNMRFGQDYYLWVLLAAETKLELIPHNLCKVRVRGQNAALRARAHIQVRMQLWDELRVDHRNIFYQKWFFFPIRIVYKLCKLEYYLLVGLEKYFRLKPKTLEFMAKTIYVLPYFLFTILFRFYGFFKRLK